MVMYPNLSGCIVQSISHGWTRTMNYYCRGYAHNGTYHCSTMCDVEVQQCDYCSAYQRGLEPPHYPVPAIPLSVHWEDTEYPETVYIEDNTYSDDPVIVWYWNAWSGAISDLS